MQVKEITGILSESRLFSFFDSEILSSLAQKATIKEYDFGDVILSQGSGIDGVHVVLKGRIRMLGVEGGKESSLGVLEQNDTTGDIVLIYDNYQYDFSLRSSGKSTICFIPTSDLRTILGKNKNAYKMAVRLAVIQTTGGAIRELLNLGADISKEEFDKIIVKVGTKRFKDGQVIIKQDDNKDKRLYAVTLGEAVITKEEDGRVLNLGNAKKGQLFAISSCIEGIPQPATITASGPTTVCVIPDTAIRELSRKSSALKEMLDKENDAFYRNIERVGKLDKQPDKSHVRHFLEFKTPRGAKVLKRFKLVEQAEEMDCGAAAMATICRHYGIQVSLGKLRSMINVTKEGASIASLVASGEKLGFRSKAIKTSWDNLGRFDIPFIIHWQDYHYIVVHGISDEQIWLADPGEGFRKIARKEFEKGWRGMVITFTPTAQLSHKVGPQTTWSRFYPYLEPIKPLLIQIFFAALLISVMGLVPPLIIQNIVDSVVTHHNISFLNVLILGMAVFALFSIFMGSLRSYLSMFMSRRIDFHMVSDFYKHILALPLSFFETRQTGAIIARFSENNRLRGFMTDTMISTILNVIMVVVYLPLMLVYNVKLTIIALAFLPIFVGLTLAATSRYKQFARKVFFAGAEQESILVETISGIDTIKGMGMEDAMRCMWERKYSKFLNTGYQSGMFDIFIGTLGGIINRASSIITLWIGAKLVIRGDLSIGQLMAFNALIGSVMGPLLSLVGVWDEFQESKVSLERIGDVLDEEPEILHNEQASRICLPDIDGHIVLHDLYFNYGENHNQYVLQNINMDIKPGSMTAIVGPSGSGKTTLIKLILGFYMPTEGSVAIDGYETTSLDLISYRQKVGYVMQNNLLFSGTTASNIALGEEEPDMDRVMEAARIADAHGFIQAMPKKYQQPVGERGVTVSGGQRQRICIARAIYQNPKMLILDEATSSLDTESESRIQQNMNEILRGRTSIVIAHRLSTVRRADCIYVIQNGHISESGKHDELIANDGVYSNLIKQQTGDMFDT